MSPTASSPLPTETDVLVVGGGPAGSTAAALLAERGWRVLLIEKDQHPRFHIGESLLPMNLPILQRLGVLEAVAGIGVRKPAADFPVDAERYNSFLFARALRPIFDHAFQVRREEFDQLLFENAQRRGAIALQQVRASAVELLPSGGAAVRLNTATGEHSVRTRYLLDASGRDTLLGTQLKLKQKNKRHQSAAIFSHFRGVARRPGPEGGNITVQRFEHGWMWLIPLRDDVMSVGAVCYPEYLKQRRGDSEGFLARTLASAPSIARRMAGAERVAPVHVTGNYAYYCNQTTGPGWIMIGDARTFIDPIFSSGVFLAMDGAEQAAAVVDATLRDPAQESRLQNQLTRRLQRGLKQFSWFIERFNSPVMRQLFRNPRNFFQVEQAVISMLAGDVFEAPAVSRRLAVFRVIYALTALRMAPRAWLSHWRRRRAAAARFADETLHDGSAAK